MTAKAEKKIPELVRHKSTKEELIARLDTVMAEDGDFIRCYYTPDEYNSAESARNSLNNSADRYGYPLKFCVRYDKLYAKRTDRM